MKSADDLAMEIHDDFLNRTLTRGKAACLVVRIKQALTAYADEKLEEAVGCVTDNPSRTVNRIRALKSRPGGAA